MDAIVRDKRAYHEQTTQRMNEHFVLPEWSIRQKLALSCRILAAQGHESGLVSLWPKLAKGHYRGTGKFSRPVATHCPMWCV